MIYLHGYIAMAPLKEAAVEELSCFPLEYLHGYIAMAPLKAITQRV